MSELKLVVLYPQPTDAEAFESEYENHKELMAQHMPGFSDYSVTRMLPNLDGSPAPYYMMAVVTYPDSDALKAAMSNPDARLVGKDAMRISTGGTPIILSGK